jgi:hypothetical protein
VSGNGLQCFGHKELACGSCGTPRAPGLLLRLDGASHYLCEHCAQRLADAIAVIVAGRKNGNGISVNWP